MRTLTPVVVRGEERQELLGFGVLVKTVYQELLSIIDPDYGDITDPVNGRDVVVEFINVSTEDI